MGLRAPLELAAAADALTLLGTDRRRTPSAAGRRCRRGFVSVNLSPHSITSGGLGAVLSGHDLSRVVVEVTEHAPGEDYPALQEAMSAFRAAGLRVAVDDAGAGYASLRHVVQLQPDLIKIDISLVRDIDLDPVKQALASSLVGFAHTTHATLVAEGVETQAEYDTVARLGVTLAQGYLLARPGERADDGRYRQPTAGALPGGRTRRPGLADAS